MSIRTTVVSLAAIALFAIGSGCEIHDCQEGAICTDHDDDHRARPGDPRQTCLDYCVRASECGAPQADDFDDCVDACRERFEHAPERTRELCECAEWSSCSDVVNGRCSERPPNAGGTAGRGGSAHAGNSAGGAPSHAGAPSAGSSAYPSAGGAPGFAGAQASGGAPGGGVATGGCSAGAGLGGATVAIGGADVGGQGTAGEGGAGESSSDGGESSCSCSL